MNMNLPTPLSAPIVAEPAVDEYRIRLAVWRWLLVAAFKKTFANFKCFLRKPTLFGAQFLILPIIPCATVFHVLFNKLGFGFRFSSAFALSTPFLILFSFLFTFRYFMDETMRSLCSNFIFMKLVNFTFPSAYSTSAKNLAAPPSTIIHAAKLDDPIIKLFGLKLLQRTCTGTLQERSWLYTLSQPGGHPRNWIALRDSALGLVRAVRDRLLFETRSRTIQTTMLKRADTPHGGRFDRGDDSECSPQQLNMSNNSSIVLNELYEGKQSFFVPPTLKPRCAEQFLPEIRKQHIRLPFFIEALLDKCRQFPLIQTPIVSSYETLCTLLAVNSLTSVIIHSLEEDQYGVVQKDLKLCLSSLARLSIAIDSYVRASGRTCHTRVYRDLNVHILDEQLAVHLKAIREVFGQYLGDLDLHSTELEVFRVLV